MSRELEVRDFFGKIFMRKIKTPKVKARPSTRDDDMEADWDYWSIAMENCKNDAHRVASPAEPHKSSKIVHFPMFAPFPEAISRAFWIFWISGRRKLSK